MEKNGSPFRKFGKTALILGGGGSRGAYEIGVWQALREMEIPIHIAAGTSVGAINGAAVAQGSFDRACRLWRQLTTTEVFDFSQAVKNGGASYTSLKKTLNENLSEQSIRDSGVEYGLVTVKAELQALRNSRSLFSGQYLWKEQIPNGQLLDYILASASCFPAVSAYEIEGSAYIDGGYLDNLPVAMALQRGAQTIIAVNLDTFGIVKKEALASAQAQGKSLFFIESPWNLGNFLIFDPKHSAHLMRLGYLDAMKAFGAFEGRRFTFMKGQMDRRTLPTAEEAAEIFRLNSETIYSKEIFLYQLAKAIDSSKKTEQPTQKLLSFQGLRRDLKRLRHMRSFDEFQRLKGTYEDICHIRGWLLLHGASSLIPSEQRVLRFLQREGLL